MKNIITAKNIASIALGLVAGVGATYAMAFTAPTTSAPGGNVAAPINTSSTAQVKAGTFGTQGLLNAGNKITTTGIGLAGMITGRSVRATQNGGFEIVGEPTGWMAAKQFCLTNNPAVGLPGDSGYDCVTAASGWSGVPGTVNGSHMYYDLDGGQGWTEATKIRLGFVPGSNGYAVAINWGNNTIQNSPTSTFPSNANTATELDVNGKVRIRGGAPATNKVLTATSGIGDAAWSSLGSQVSMVHASTSDDRQLAVSCGLNKQVIGGGGSCVLNNGLPAFLTKSYPVNTGDPLFGNPDNLTGLPSPIVPANQGNGWAVNCSDYSNIHVWAMCVPE